ncbi:MAG: CPBP family intramembrane metalloprotease [Victivallaceae bacterium]|nr:CPBP family intramembrane metalloprotease [Victivallaceae bacterium]
MKIKLNFEPPWQLDIAPGWLAVIFVFGFFGNQALVMLMGGVIVVISHITGWENIGNVWLAPVCLLADMFFLSLVLAVYYLLNPRGRLMEKLGLRSFTKRDILTAIIFFAAAAIAVVAATGAWQWGLDTWHIPYAQEQDISSELRNAGPLLQVAFAIVTIILAPLFEELLFRRTLFGALLPLGTAGAVVGASLVFALVHFFLLGLPGLFLLGLAFQLSYLVSRNLAVPMAMHAVWNLSSFIITLAGWDI